MIEQLESRNLILTVREDGGFELLEKSTGTRFGQVPGPFRATAFRTEGDGIAYRLEGAPLPLTAHLRIARDECVVLRLEGEGALGSPLAYPLAWASARGDEAILPVGTGVALPVELEAGLPETLCFYAGGQLSMGLFGLRRKAHYLFSCVGEICDAELALERDENGLLRPGVLWAASKGEFAYPREIRYFLGWEPAEPLRRYRRWRDELRSVATLKEKCRVNPGLERFWGAASFWLWDDNAMNRLYGRPLSSSVTELAAETVADELLRSGVDRLLWNSFDGETPETCAGLKRRGFLVGKYDVYRDVIPKPLADRMLPYRRERSVNTSHWPGIATVGEDGAYRPAWALHGIDGGFYEQHSVCDLAALELTRRNVPPDVARVGYTARFIDVQGAAKLQECYSPDHPAARRDSRAAIRRQTEYLSTLGLVAGVEMGGEATLGSCHYSEGLMSPPYWRAPDSGRRMTTQYRGDQIPGVIRNYMLNPAYRIPLFQLAWHDCCVNYWYWGDSSNSCPELVRTRDLFNLLYGEPPLYSLAKAEWAELRDIITASYRRVSPVVRRLATAKMTNFERLTGDALVQRTTFDDGTVVTVNFSDREFVSGSFQLAPQSYHADTAKQGDPNYEDAHCSLPVHAD